MKCTIRQFASLVLVVMFGVGVGVANAQITVTESDLRESIGQRIAIQSVVAKDTTDFQATANALFNQTGGNQTFDFTPFAYGVEFEGIQDRVPVEEASSDVPFLSRFEQQGADVVSATRFNAIQEGATDSTFWGFEGFEDQGYTFYGASFVSNVDLDGDGETPDSSGFQYSPGLLQFPLPLSNGDTWEQQNEFSIIPSNLFSTQEDRQSEVDGWGTLVTPAGSVPVLRIRTVTTDTVSVFGQVQVSTTTNVQFFSTDFSLSASIGYDNDTETIIGVSYTVVANVGESYTVAQGDAPTFEDAELGTRLRFTQGSSTPGQVDVSRYDTAPFNNTISGSASSSDGTTVTPNAVWEGGYFSVRNDGLEGFAADFCVDVSGLPGVSDAATLVLGKRETSNNGWTPVTSVLDGDFLCAEGLASFSQFAVMSDSTSNPLPVELARLTATTDGQDAVLEWETASERDNAGFHIEHQAASEPWSAVGFVEGAGTTAEPQRYTFRVADLDMGTHAFRLRQVDVDGTADVSEAVTVQIRPEAAFVLSDVRPHPIRDGATFTLSVRESQDVTVEVFDLLGRRVTTLHDGVVRAGGRVDLQIDPAGMTSGMYLLRAVGGNHQVTRKMTVVR